uniref:Core Histone H2A/H2B/H3 domain-containing protein n=1 Tax=Leersia perrieri TaxID=77586 RepID=A0A0D9XY37_9ORYZ
MPMSHQQMDEFWSNQQKDIEAIKDFSDHAIPMARLKNIVSSQKGNMMMTFDMPAFLSKMCELFVQELAIRAWACAQSHNRCIILDTDIAEAIASTECYDFLVDTLHKHRVKHNSTPRSTLVTKRFRLLDQPSTSYQPGQDQLPCFNSTYTSNIHVNPNFIPPTPQYRPFSFPSSPQKAPTPIMNVSMLSIHNIARGLGLQGNNINTIVPNNTVDCSSPIVLSGVTSPTLLKLTEASLNTPNSQSCKYMMDMINSIDANGSSTSNIVVANQASLALRDNFNPSFCLPSSSPLLPSNNNEMEGVGISDTMHVASDGVDATTIVLDGQQEQHESEANVDHPHQNEIYGSIDVETIQCYYYTW